ncbi:MAG: hypothetical protein K2W95_12405 [Candidatus Obscuribacterales bacterium]|nr:hypothetical protein [Candidatus Obscuribacterales bacterium]
MKVLRGDFDNLPKGIEPAERTRSVLERVSKGARSDGQVSNTNGGGARESKKNGTLRSRYQIYESSYRLLNQLD